MKKIGIVKNSFKKKIIAVFAAALLCLGMIGGVSPISETAIAEESATLSSLIEAAEGTLALDKDYVENVSVAAGKSITLDLAGHSINGKITNAGTLTLVDSIGTGSVWRTSGDGGVQSVIDNSGTLTINGATVRGTGTGTATEANVVVNNSDAKLYMRGGAIIATTTSTQWSFGINNLGVIEEISGGRIESHITHTSSASNALAINNAGTIKSITGGTVYADHAGGNASTGAGYATAIRVQGTGVIENISGGKLEAKHANKGYAAALFVNGGTVKNISGGTLYAENNGDKNYATALQVESGKVENIAGGALSAYVNNNKTDDPKAYGVYVKANGTIDRITGGDIFALTTAKQWAFGIWNLGTIKSIEGGTIRAVINHNLASPNAIAICNDKTINSVSGGTLYAYSSGANGGTIGIRTRFADSTVGSITGGAVYINKVNAENYFRAESAGVNTFGEGYALGKATSSGYRYVLASGQTVTEEYKDGDSVMTGTVKAADGSTVKEYKLAGTELAAAASIGGMNFDSITEAVAASAAGDTVVVGRDLTEDVIVAAGKDITLDFAGHTVTGTLNNSGSATLTSSERDGGLYKRSEASGASPVVNNRGTLTVDGIDIRNDGMGAEAQANGINNEVGATLNYICGTLRTIEYGKKWAFPIVSKGVVNISGGNIQALAFDSGNTNNTVAVAMSGDGRLTVTGGNIYAQSAGKSVSGSDKRFVIGVRTQGTSTADIRGGSIKAVATNGNDSVPAYGIYTESASSSATVSGGTVAAETYSDWAFGINAAKGGVTVTGGKIYGAAYHKRLAPNIIGIAVSANVVVNVSGGYIYGYNANLTGNGDTYGIRNGGTLNISGGVLGYNKSVGNSAYVYTTNTGTTNYVDGVKIVASEAFDKIGYAVKDGDVIVEQRDGDRFIGVDVMRGGNVVYSFDDHKKDGYALSGYKKADDTVVSKADFAGMTESAVVDAVYGKAPTYLFLGSSVTYGAANHGSSFVNYIASMTECRVIKEAVSGTTLTDSIANSYVSRLLKVSKSEKVDHIIIQLSTNDATREGVTIGDVTANDKKALADFDKNTTVGAMEYIIAYAKETWGCKVTFYTNPKFDNAKYSTLLTMLDKVKAKWDIGVVDFYNYKDMDALDDATYRSYMADAIHPNAAGYEWMGRVFTEYLTK